MNFFDLFKLNRIIINIGGYLKYYKYFLFDHSIISSVSKAKAISANKRTDKCYICALGPSLKEVNFEAIDGDTIVVNRFYKQGQKLLNFEPTYYLMIDALFSNPENKQDLFNALDYYKNGHTKFLLNSKLKKLDEIKPYKENIAYVSCCKGWFNSNMKFTLGKVMPAFGNVACTAIAFAIALGYNEIILLGCDFNSFASRKKVHCYQEVNENRTLDIAYELFCYALDAEIHTELNTYALKRGIKIINSSKGSLIDAYPYNIIDSLYK